MEAVVQWSLYLKRRPLQSFSAEEIDDLNREELQLLCMVHSIALDKPGTEGLESFIFKRTSKLRRALKRKCGFLPFPAENPPSSGGVPPSSLPLAKTKDSLSSDALNIQTLKESFASLVQGNGGAPSDVLFDFQQVSPPLCSFFQLHTGLDLVAFHLHQTGYP
jgi:hypothetical protein